MAKREKFASLGWSHINRLALFRLFSTLTILIEFLIREHALKSRIRLELAFGFGRALSEEEKRREERKSEFGQQARGEDMGT